MSPKPTALWLSDEYYCYLHRMNKEGPIIIIEDDLEDQEFIKRAYKNLKYPNKLFFFNNGEEALEYLNKP